jgi:hypothetical protein
MERLVRLLIVSVLAGFTPALVGTATAASANAAPEDAWHLCADTARQIERAQHLPETILEAITTVETARAAPGEPIVRPWPWTVTAEGKGYHFESMKAAIEAVRALRARGVESIDVGCMQVNLHYHPGAFTSLEEAFNPLSNVTYAVALLQNLKDSQGTWESAIEHYHSYDPALRLAYRLKVFSSWQTISHEREVFRLASEVSLEHLGAPGAPVQPEAMLSEGPVLAKRDSRHRIVQAGFLGGSVIRLTSLDSVVGEDAPHPAPMVVIAVDLRPRASDRPDPSQASIFGGGTVAVADPGLVRARD